MLGYYKHRAAANDCEMRFAVFMPPQAVERAACRCCTTSPGSPAPRKRSSPRRARSSTRRAIGIMLVAPDTSPRVELPGDRESLGLRHRRRLLSRCHAGAVVEALPHVQLRGGRAARRDRGELHVRISRAAASSATRWAGTARSPSRSRIRTSTDRCPRSRRSPRRCRCRGARRRSPATSAPIARAGSQYDATELVQGRPQVSRHACSSTRARPTNSSPSS